MRKVLAALAACVLLLAGCSVTGDASVPVRLLVFGSPDDLAAYRNLTHGGKLVDDPHRPTRFTLDDPATREALKNLIDLRLAYDVTPTDEQMQTQDDEARFANGRLAMLLSSRRSTTALRQVTAFTWDVATLPTYDQPAGIPHFRRVPTISTWPQIEDVTEGILENAMYRGDRLDDVIAEIDKQTRPLFARAEGP